MRILLTVLLMLATSQAWASWARVHESAAAVFYVDPTTLRKDGNVRSVWQLQDVKGRAPKGELSFRILNEYNCKDKLVRRISRIAHSGHMATGTARVIGKESAVRDKIAPHTPDYVVLKFVCAQ